MAKPWGRYGFRTRWGSEAGAYQLHPALLNACFQVLGAAFPATAAQETYIPVGIERVAVFGRPGLRPVEPCQPAPRGRPAR